MPGLFLSGELVANEKPPHRASTQAGFLVGEALTQLLDGAVGRFGKPPKNLNHRFNNLGLPIESVRSDNALAAIVIAVRQKRGSTQDERIQ